LALNQVIAINESAMSRLVAIGNSSNSNKSIHGDADDVVPYSHAVRLHQALDKAGVTNELYTIKGGGRGQFKPEDNRRGYDAVWQFLRKLNLGPVK
jgi:hypothetical protein